MSAPRLHDAASLAPRIGRRTVLAGLAGMAVALGGASALRRERLPEDAASALHRRLVALVDGAGAIAIGRQYLSAHAHEATPAALLAAIVATRPADWSADGGPRRLRARIRSAVQDDFARGDTVTLDGWMLSVTEARLCALRAVA